MPRDPYTLHGGVAEANYQAARTAEDERIKSMMKQNAIDQNTDWNDPIGNAKKAIETGASTLATMAGFVVLAGVAAVFLVVARWFMVDFVPAWNAWWQHYGFGVFVGTIVVVLAVIAMRIYGNSLPEEKKST